MEAERTVNLDRPKPRGIDRILRATRASWQGLTGAFRNEAAFRQELALAVVVIPLGLWLGHTGVERALLVAPMLLVGRKSIPGQGPKDYVGWIKEQGAKANFAHGGIGTNGHLCAVMMGNALGFKPVIDI